MNPLFFIIYGCFCYFIGVFVGTKMHHVKKDEVEWRKMKAFKSRADIFEEDILFIEPKDVVESYKQSSTIDEFINKIK